MMREDVSGELSLGEFAQSVNLSVWRLCHLFKSDIGMPPMRYLRVLRMERAKDLLESSFLSVKEIGFRVGLTDESHFVRDFKATYGLSPACYRAQFRHNDAIRATANRITAIRTTATLRMETRTTATATRMTPVSQDNWANRSFASPSSRYYQRYICSFA